MSTIKRKKTFFNKKQIALCVATAISATAVGGILYPNQAFADSPVFTGKVTATGGFVAGPDADGNKTEILPGKTTISDKDGNTNVSTPTGDAIKDKDGNGTTITKDGVTVGGADGKPSSSLTKDGLTTTDKDGNTTTISGDAFAKGTMFAGNAMKTGETTNVSRKLGETLKIYGAASGVAANAGLSNAAATAGTFSSANLQTVTDAATGALQIQFADAPVFTGTVTSTAGFVAGPDADGNKTEILPGKTTISDKDGNKNESTALGDTITDKDGNKNASTALGDTITDKDGNKNEITAKGDTITDKDGNKNASTALGDTITDKDGNKNEITAKGDTITDKDGNKNASTALGNTITDKDGNKNESTATKIAVVDKDGVGTNITKDGVTVAGADGKPASSLTKDGLTFTDKDGTSTTITGEAFAKGTMFAGNAMKTGETTIVSRKMGETLKIYGAASGVAANAGLSDVAVTAGTFSSANIQTVTDAATGSVQIQLADAPVFTGKVTANGVDAGAGGVTTTGDIKTTGGSIIATDGKAPESSTKLTSAGTTITDDKGNTNVSTAASDTLKDKDGNTNVSTAKANTITDKDGNSNVSTALGTTITDKDGNSTTVSAAGLAIKDGTTITKDKAVIGSGEKAVTIDGSTGKITNLTAGTVGKDSKEAVNGSQIYNSMSNIKDVLGAGITLSDDGKLTGSNIGGTTANTVAGAIAEVGELAKKHTTVVEGANVKVTEATNASGGKEYTVAVKDDITLTSVTTGDTKMDTTGVTIANADPTKTVSLTNAGLNNGGNKITNIAAGDISKDSKDAVNGSQLFTTNTQVAGNTTALGGGASFDPQTNTYTPPKYNVTDAEGNAKEVNDVGSAIDALNQGFKVTSDKVGSGTVSGTAVTPVKSGNTMTYVAGDNISLTQDGMKFTIATNKEVSFDKVTSKEVVSDKLTVGPVVISKDTGINAGGTVLTGIKSGALTPNSTDAVTGAQLFQTNQAMGQLRDDTYAGDAMNAALSALKPLQYDPMEPTQIMAGMGLYKGHYAGSIGIAHYRNESNMYNVGFSMGGTGKFMVNAGATWKFGSSKNERDIAPEYRKGPMSSVYVMQKENVMLKGKVQELESNNNQLQQTTQNQAKELELLKQQMRMMMERMGM